MLTARAPWAALILASALALGCGEDPDHTPAATTAPGIEDPTPTPTTSPAPSPTATPGETPTPGPTPSGGDTPTPPPSPTASPTSVQTPTPTAEPENRPPTARILSPSPDDTFEQGDAVPLRGEATDPEEGPLSGGSLTWTSSLDGRLGSGASLDPTTLTEGSHRLSLLAVDGDGATGQALVTIAIVLPGTDQPPVAQILAPEDGSAVREGALVRLEGQGTDPEDGALTGASLVWASSIDGALGSGAVVEITPSVGVHSVTLTVTDSFGNARGDGITLVVNRADQPPPVATILAPEDGAIFEEGEAISFVGEGTLGGGVSLDGAFLSWASDLSGELGVGAEIVAEGLAVGDHRITLTALGPEGGIGVDAISITLLPEDEDAPPVVTITAPEDGATFEAGEVISFVGVALDPEEGALSGGALTWTSDRDGRLGQGGAISAPLTEGAHVITLTAVDAGANVAQARIGLGITPGTAENIPPIASLSGPGQVPEGGSGTFDASGSTDRDGEINRFVFSVDGEALQDGGASTFTHIFDAPGSRLVSVTVFDDDGAEASASLPVAVSAYIPLPRTVLDSRYAFSGACALGFTPEDRAVVAVFEGAHRQLILAEEGEDGRFTARLIDGPGLDVEGPVTDALDVEVDGAGAIHLAWLLPEGAGGWVRYGRLNPDGAWVGITLDPASLGFLGWEVSIALNPTDGERPAILFREPDGVSIGLLTCVGDCGDPEGWTSETVYREERGASSNLSWPGDLGFDGEGTLHALFGASYDAEGRTTTRIHHRSRSAGGSWGDVVDAVEVTVSQSAYPARLGVDAAGEPFAATLYGLSHPVGDGWPLSRPESGELTFFDVLVEPQTDRPVVVRRATNRLELVEVNEGGYFVYADLGRVDAAWPQLASDGAGRARACFIRDGNVLVY